MTVLVVYLLLALIVFGHLAQILFARDDWPLSSYPMYAFKLVDRRRNPFLPFREAHTDYEGGFLVLSAVYEDEKVPLTLDFEHPLIHPFDRIRLVRQLATLNRKGADPAPFLTDLAKWIRVRARSLDQSPPVRLDLELYLWRQVPERPEKNCAPDRVEVICRHEVGDA